MAFLLPPPENEMRSSTTLLWTLDSFREEIEQVESQLTKLDETPASDETQASKEENKELAANTTNEKGIKAKVVLIVSKIFAMSPVLAMIPPSEKASFQHFIDRLDILARKAADNPLLRKHADPETRTQLQQRIAAISSVATQVEFISLKEAQLQETVLIDKGVLVMHSLFFRQMFQNTCIEGLAHEVKIPGFSAGFMELLKRYLSAPKEGPNCRCDILSNVSQAAQIVELAIFFEKYCFEEILNDDFVPALFNFFTHRFVPTEDNVRVCLEFFLEIEMNPRFPLNKYMSAEMVTTWRFAIFEQVLRALEIPYMVKKLHIMYSINVSDSQDLLDERLIALLEFFQIFLIVKNPADLERVLIAYKALRERQPQCVDFKIKLQCHEMSRKDVKKIVMHRHLISHLDLCFSAASFALPHPSVTDWCVLGALRMDPTWDYLGISVQGNSVNSTLAAAIRKAFVNGEIKVVDLRGMYYLQNRNHKKFQWVSDPIPLSDYFSYSCLSEAIDFIIEKSLTAVNLRGFNLVKSTAAALLKLPFLRDLDIEGCTLDKDFVKAMVQLPSLEGLYVNRCDLEYISEGHNEALNELTQAIVQFPALKRLSLSLNSFSNILVSKVRELRTLERLYLEVPQEQDDSIASIGKIVVHLDVAQLITDNPLLRELTLYELGLTKSLVQAIRQHRALERVTLQGCEFSLEMRDSDLGISHHPALKHLALIGKYQVQIQNLEASPYANEVVYRGERKCII